VRSFLKLVLYPVLSERLAAGLAWIVYLIAVNFLRLSALLTTATNVTTGGSRLRQGLTRRYLSDQLLRVLLLETLASGFAFFIHFRFALGAQLIVALRFRRTESLQLRFAIGRAAAVLTAEIRLHRRLHTRLHGRFLRAIVQGRLRRLRVIFEAFRTAVVVSRAAWSFASLAAALAFAALVIVGVILRVRNAVFFQACRQFLSVQSRDIFLALGVGLVVAIAAALVLSLLRRFAVIVGKTGVHLRLQSLQFSLLGLSILLRLLGPGFLQALAILLKFAIAVRRQAAGNVAGDESEQNDDSLHTVRSLFKV